MKKNPKIFLHHILESITAIEKYTESFTKTQFLKTPQLQDAVTRRLEIMGEAVKNIPANLKSKNQNSSYINKFIIISYNTINI